MLGVFYRNRCPLVGFSASRVTACVKARFSVQGVNLPVVGVQRLEGRFPARWDWFRLIHRGVIVWARAFWFVGVFVEAHDSSR